MYLFKSNGVLLHKCCNLIGYASPYQFLDRQQVKQVVLQNKIKTGACLVAKFLTTSRFIPKTKKIMPPWFLCMTVDLEVAVIDYVMTEILDLSQYLTNCSPTPPLTQH